MGSMERAPEPTMEEILASIRRIISDDEAKAAESPPASPPEAKAAEVDADADTKIIDDIARVLSGAAPAESVSDDDDILDLTKELSELQSVADETAALPELAYPAAAPTQVTETIILAETEIAEPEARATEPVIAMPPPAEEPSALDLAIAELRAREQARMAQVREPVFQPSPEPLFEAGPEAFDDGEPELVLTNSETETVTAALYEPEFVEEPSAPAPSLEPEVPAWPSFANAPEPEPEPVKAPESESSSNHINGNGSHGMRTTHYSEFGINANRSLEDSVKEMLRPLLREWLDEHMSRVLEAALRDELKDAEERWQRNEQRRRPY
jgi:uncharacterized protein